MVVHLAGFTFASPTSCASCAGAIPDLIVSAFLALLYLIFFYVRQRRLPATGNFVVLCITTTLLSGALRTLLKILSGSLSQALTPEETLYIGVGCLTLAFVSFLDIVKRFRVAAARHEPGWEDRTGSDP